ncbi:MAG: 30S ribosomal protein S8 [Acidobacteria bacterium]|nr:30S ribosomal protein S8 [Acidobacteriota bacterium]
MVMTDPISDMLTRVRNALMGKHARTEMPASKIKVEIAKILKEEGYIDNFKVVDEEGRHSRLVLDLRYGPRGERVLNGLERVSRPGCRVYAGMDEIPKVLGGIGISILSTSRGLMSGDDARQRRLGGEVLCKIW